MRSDDLEGFGPVGTNGPKPEPVVMADEDIKPAINNLLWMYAHENMTLGEAEQRALRILAIIKEPL